MCKTSLTDSDVAHALIMTSIAKFAAEYDERLLDSSFYSDIEDIEVEPDNIVPDQQIFLSQPEPLIVKNKNWIEYHYDYRGRKHPVRKFDTKYYRIIEVK